MFFQTQIFFPDPKLFRTQNFLRLKTFFGLECIKNILYIFFTQNFVKSKYYLNPRYFLDPKFLFVCKNFRTHKIVPTNFFFIFHIQNFVRAQKILGPKTFFLNPKFFWVKIFLTEVFLDPKFFLDPNILFVSLVDVNIYKSIQNPMVMVGIFFMWFGRDFSIF